MTALLMQLLFEETYDGIQITPLRLGWKSGAENST